MPGAIFFSGKYGSTEQYSNWISEATGLPVFDIQDSQADPSDYEYVILGSSILYFRLTNRKWIRTHWPKLEGRPILLFSVSGAGPGAKLDRWIKASLPSKYFTHMTHVGLRGKLDHTKVSWWVRQILWVGSLFNPDKDASKDERHGFDYMDKDSIAPILKWVTQHQAHEVPVS